MSIKLIALDLDGTTLNEKGRITDRTRTTLEAAAEGGVNIVVATGRPFTALPADIFDVSAIRYVITSNGASITDLKEDKVIYRNCMSPLTAEKAVELLRNLPYIIEAFTYGEAYMQADYYNQVKRTRQSFRGVDYLLNTREPMEDIFGYILDHKEVIENINVNLEDISV
ncbi:MAG: HAD family phosphatase, partial [Eubacterium sp.]|nr:HAD family phosphatase [Candidatus Colimonas fimequi]